MPIKYDPSGRIQPVPFGLMAHPATCALCRRVGRTQDEEFAYLGVELEDYGCFYLCQDCCREVGNFIGSVPAEEHENLQGELLVLNAKYIGVIKQVDYLKGLLNARIDSARSGEPDSDGSTGLPVSEVDRATDPIDAILNANKPESIKSGAR